MALLKSMRAVVLLGLGLGACGLGLFGDSPAPLAFSHRVHGEAGLDCGDCHGDWQAADAPGMPVQGGCMLCHGEIDQQKPPERRIDGLFDGRGYRATRAARLGGDVIFSHQAHANRGGQCNECHQGIEQNDRIDATFALTMTDCRDCHATKAAPTDCAACHREIRVDRAPPSHTLAWTERHGRVWRAHGGGAADDCAMCHEPSSCTSCHLDEPPKNHDEYFRLRGHGLRARMDRQNCAACHRSDSCDTCHRTSEPLSHGSATWGAPRAAHCVSCHSLSRADDCATCHAATPSHDLATALPASHNPGMNCRQCHGQGQPLQHVDKGGVCIECHR